MVWKPNEDDAGRRRGGGAGADGVAGAGGGSGIGGPPSRAYLDGPRSVATNTAGNLLIADGGNSQIRMITG